MDSGESHLIQELYKQWLAARLGTEGEDGMRHSIEMSRLERTMASSRTSSLDDMTIKLIVSKETDNHLLIDSVLSDLAPLLETS